jgi:hypothetical protein
MGSPKEEVEALLRRLPDDCTMEEIEYHVYVLRKVRRGIASARTETTLQEQAEAHLGRWLPM